ncbi:hypothetical protein L683_01190 [Pseudomonas aeruginosa WC55]|nr:hypothetical protein L683_01190 [Pseudomonas aeruginosa WC55]KWX30842.1 hypothetical protein AW882_05595 [Pseudomonas aeruginosa]KWX52645.1 hypothetical protein AW884_05590 [Pseudomonas aeruginosa]KWX54212.1 hypothetical protein AW881_05610 [Pseudomonas aeruginosa]
MQLRALEAAGFAGGLVGEGEHLVETAGNHFAEDLVVGRAETMQALDMHVAPFALGDPVQLMGRQHQGKVVQCHIQRFAEGSRGHGGDADHAVGGDRQVSQQLQGGWLVRLQVQQAMAHQAFELRQAQRFLAAFVTQAAGCAHPADVAAGGANQRFEHFQEMNGKTQLWIRQGCPLHGGLSSAVPGACPARMAVHPGAVSGRRATAAPRQGQSPQRKSMYSI